MAVTNPTKNTTLVRVPRVHFEDFRERNHWFPRIERTTKRYHFLHLSVEEIRMLKEDADEHANTRNRFGLPKWRVAARTLSKALEPHLPTGEPHPPQISTLGKLSKTFTRLVMTDAVSTEDIAEIHRISTAWMDTRGETHRHHPVTWACQKVAQCEINEDDMVDGNLRWWQFRMAVNKLDMACND